MKTIETADTVHHAPTGEDWLVAYVNGDTLCPCGWPETFAKISDCLLTKKATEAEKAKLIQELASMRATGYDSRRSWAQSYLKREIA